MFDETGCWLAVIGLFCLMFFAACSDHRLENQKQMCSQKYERTVDYLACLKPVEDQLKQEADDAAVSAAITSTIVTTTMN